MAQMRVFVSHSHSNNAFCAELVRGLQAAGADVWYDEQTLHAGQLGPVIERELRDRPVFVVVLSPAALQSRWVEDETRWAYGLLRRDPSRILLPVLAEALPDEGDIWLFLQDFKRVEASGLWPFSSAEAVSRTLRALQLTRPGEAPLPTAPQQGDNANELLLKGKALFAQDRDAEALELFKQVTQIAPGNFEAWANLGRAYTWTGNPTEGLAASGHALDIQPDFALGWYAKGNALRKLGRNDEALAAYDRALALDHDYAPAWNNKGAVLNGLKRYAEALAANQRALELDPNFANAAGGVVIALRGLGRTAEAEEAARRAKALGR
jgi:tetratricopeptide (TPR) repeat protein